MLTLGINYSRMHDSSACIVRDGELLFAVAEERISRLKHDAGFPKKRDSSLPGLRESGTGGAGRSVLRVADGWAGLPARPEVLRHGKNAANVSHRFEFDAALPEHVASGKRSQEIRAAVRADQSENAVCRSPPRTCHQCLRVFRN